MQSVDVGFTHVAFTVRCLATQHRFLYPPYRDDCHSPARARPPLGAGKWHGSATAPGLSPWCWCKVTIRPIRPLGPFGHLGVACATQAEIDEKVALARREGVLRREPEQLGDPVGYFAFFADPDGNTLELSWGQRVGLEVILAGKPGE